MYIDECMHMCTQACTYTDTHTLKNACFHNHMDMLETCYNDSYDVRLKCNLNIIKHHVLTMLDNEINL